MIHLLGTNTIFGIPVLPDVDTIYIILLPMSTVAGGLKEELDIFTLLKLFNQLYWNAYQGFII